jgi:hypothetical protein
MTNVVNLINGEAVPSSGEPNKHLIALLSDLMSDAQSGRLQSMIGTGFMSDGLRVGIWCDYHPNYYEMLGAIARLQSEYIGRHDDN